MEIRDVWRCNFDEELILFDRCLRTYNFLSFDTEFPGFLRNTPRDASEAIRYDDLKSNVDTMKIIQLGITLSDGNGHICSTWEFNFCDFDVKKDPHVEVSIDLLKRNGVDFEKIGKDGVSSNVFVPKFLQVLSRHRNLRWVTFHGLYDLAYALKLLTSKPMPRTVLDFVKEASGYFECVFDIKFMAKYCKGLLGGKIGLNRVAKILGVERFGDAHNAGSDSQLTASVFAKMKKVYGIQEGIFVGCLYGISARIRRARPTIVVVPRYCQPLILGPPYPLPAIAYCGSRRPFHPQTQYYVPAHVQYPCTLKRKFHSFV